MVKAPDYTQEKAFLNTIYHAYTLDEAPHTQWIKKLVFRVMEPFLNGGTALELGCSDGYMTAMIASKVDTLHVVDASENFVKEAAIGAPKHASFYCALFEEYDTETRYDYIIASFILEHVLEVAPVLSVVKKLLKPGGRFFAVVPNARALSRQLALHMGLIKDLYELTENDKKFGHRRVYDRAHFNKDLHDAGFHSIYQTGIFLKILADFQMDKLLNDQFLRDEHMEGLFKLGQEYPDLCNALFSMCEVRG